MKRRKYLFGSVVLVLALALIVVARLGQGASSATSHMITLQANGGTPLDVTYSVGSRNSQDTSAASPWLASYQATGDIPTMTMTVQNGGGVSVSCSITEDGHVVNSNTSYGPYAVVQCSA